MRGRARKKAPHGTATRLEWTLSPNLILAVILAFAVAIAAPSQQPPTPQIQGEQAQPPVPVQQAPPSQASQPPSPAAGAAPNDASSGASSEAPSAASSPEGETVSGHVRGPG